MGEKGVLYFLLMFVPSVSFGFSGHSQYIWGLQKKFQNASANHTLIYLDREILDERLKTVGWDFSLEQDQSIRNDVVKQYVFDRLGIRIDDFAADSFGDWYSTGANVAIPTQNKETGEKYCGIMASNPSKTALENGEKYLYWDQMKGHTDEYDGLEIDNKFSKKQFNLMTDLHETFHCLDDWYVVKKSRGEYETQDIVHRAESFAEVGALLYLSTQGERQLAMNRALYRIVGSFMVGRHKDLLGSNFIQGIESSVVYSFFPALFEVHSQVEKGFSSNSLDEIKKLAHEITEAKSLDSHMQHAVLNYQKNPDELDDLIKRFAHNPEEKGPLRQRFVKIEEARDKYAEVVDWAFSNLFTSESSAKGLVHSQ